MMALNESEFRDYLAKAICGLEMEKRDNLIEEKYDFIECINDQINGKDNLIKNTDDSTTRIILIKEKCILIAKKSILLMKIDILIKEKNIMAILGNNNLSEDDYFKAKSVLNDKNDILIKKMSVLLDEMDNFIEWMTILTELPSGNN